MLNVPAALLGRNCDFVVKKVEKGLKSHLKSQVLSGVKARVTGVLWFRERITIPGHWK